MYMTRGIVVDTGAALVQDPLYDDKIKVRIPDLHGYGDLVSSFQEKSYTKDEDLPWCKIITTRVTYPSVYGILAHKAQSYSPADIVYVQVEENISNPNYYVRGTYARYNEESESNEALNVYNGIDVSSILANNVEFPEGLLAVYKTQGSSDDEDNPDVEDDNEDDNEDDGPARQDGTGADNSIETWKYVFGNPLSSKSLYYISARFPRYSSGDKHSGVDLCTSGKVGIPIYSAADGSVVKRGGPSGDAGNYLIIHHKYKNKDYYTIYEHMQTGSVTVKIGSHVKGTQLVADTEWTQCYQKHGHNYTRLTKKPSDWDFGGWHKYYKLKSGTTDKYETVGDKKQEATMIGRVGNTGRIITNQTGPGAGAHLHFGITTNQNSWYNSQTFDGYLKDPESFISL